MTTDQRNLLILGVGAVALWVIWRSRQGLPMLPVALTGGAGTPAGTVGGTASSWGTPLTNGIVSPGQLTINSPAIVAARGAATGPCSRHACQRPSRWINTTTAPYYGFCVTEEQFQEWMSVSGGVEGTVGETADRETVMRLMRWSLKEGQGTCR